MVARKIDVLCIGHAAYDVQVYMNGFPAENSKVEIATMLESGGGPAANAAYLLSSWGTSCAFAGLIGDDYYGQRLAGEFTSVRTDLSLLERRPGHATPFSVILVNQANGSRTIINRKQPTGPYILDQARLRELEPGMLYFDGHEREAAQQALEAFPGVPTVLDAGSLRPGTEMLAPLVDYLIASERFALQWAGLEALDTPNRRQEALGRLRKLNPGKVVVTLGEHGLVFHEGGQYRAMEAFKVEAVDTTAAGDIFHGALAWALVKHYPFEEALRLASMTASLSVTVRGGRPSIPDPERVLETLRNG
jgi:sulfofructose kinase